MPSYQSQTRAQIRQAVGYLAYARQLFFADTVATVMAPGFPTFNKVRQYPDDTLLGRGLYFATGPNAGQQRTVMHSYESTGQITTTSSFGSTPVVGNTGEFWPGDIAADTINANINTAIGRGSDVVNTYIEAIPTIDSTRMIVDIPANFTRLVGFNYFYNGVIYNYALTDWLDSNYDQAMVRGRKLYLSNAVQSSATDMVVQGYRVPALPTQDSDVIEMNPEFVKLMAAALTEAGDAAMPGYDPEASTARSQVWFREAMDVRQNMISDWLSDTRGIPL
jgi:hypothetical protein